MNEAYKQRLKAYWTAQLQTLFPGGLPKKDALWSDPLDILHVLNVLALEPTSNQIYTPEGGWANLRRSHPSAEPGCIELGFTTPKLVKPQTLVFENLGGDILWNYFRIITGVQRPSGLHQEEYYRQERFSETVYQIVPVRYAATEQGYDKEECYEASETTRQLNRYFGGGDFVIASPASPLNQILLKDETLHQRLGDKGFRDYIQELVNQEKGERN